MFLSKLQTILLLIVIGLILPIYANAFLDGPIVPCGTRASNKDCTLCDIFKMGQNIINFIWELIIVIVPIFILAGGIMILTAGAKPDQVGLGKKIIFNAIIGMVIAFLSWTIINMVFNTLVGEGKKEGFPWPWNEIQCKGGGVSEGEEEIEEGEYCVCEVPVYDLNPNDFPSEATLIGTNAKVNILSSKEECVQKCVAANASTYCRPSLKPYTALYCADKTGLQSKSACTLYVKTNANCQISSTCYSSETDCLNAASTTFKSRCYLDGQFLCTCYTGSQKGLCGNSTSQYVLWRVSEETPSGGSSLWDCNNASPYYCRLDCKYDKCQPTIINRCNQMSPAGSCFGGYACQKGVADQQKDASTELKNFLNCVAEKSYLPVAAKEISSISDNSDGRCFKEWNSQCGSGKDSCEGTCCGHSKCSLHYGGKARIDSGPAECGIGSIDCRMYSYAVDFAKEQYFDQIKKAAGECAKQLWSGSLEDIDVIKEGDHVHVELEGIAKYHKCK